MVAVAQLDEFPDQILPGLARPDRIAQGDPTAALDAVHEKRPGVVAQDEVLVAQQGQVGVGPGRGFDDGADLRRRVDVQGLRLGPGRHEEPGHGVEEDQSHRARRAAQEARRIAPEREPPPQVVRVVHVLVGEQAQPDRAQQDDDDQHHPPGAESLGGQGGLAVELAPAGQQGGQHDAQDDRLFVVQPLEQREEYAERRA